MRSLVVFLALFGACALLAVAQEDNFELGAAGDDAFQYPEKIIRAEGKP